MHYSSYERILYCLNLQNGGRDRGTITTTPAKLETNITTSSPDREYYDLNILLFPELLRLTSAMDRILTRPGGSALMIGRPGVGRRPAAGIISCMHGFTIYTPRVTAGYGFRHFAADIKQVR